MVCFDEQLSIFMWFSSGRLTIFVCFEDRLSIFMWFCSRNQLQELPDCIGRLCNLVSLHAEHNKLTQLCPEVVDCRKLEELVSKSIPLVTSAVKNVLGIFMV